MTHRSTTTRRFRPRRGMMLVVTLVIIAVISLLAASFAFRMNADLSAVRAYEARQQARFAVDSGLEWVMHYLRQNRNNAFGDGETEGWYDNPDLFKRIIVSGDVTEETIASTAIQNKDKIVGKNVCRFSVLTAPPVVSDIEAVSNEEKFPRYGISDEASKVNINTASRGQLIELIGQLELEDVYPTDLADALIDWRDKDDEKTGLGGAESNYYITLNPPYRAKNGPLDTVEELLMVKGFNGRILYGEDYNLNGYLDANEDDGEQEVSVFPPDNGDGKLQRGLLPLITVHSWDFNNANDNKPRLNLNTVDLTKTEELDEVLLEELNEETINFIVEARKRGFRFRSAGELYGLEVYEDGSSNYDAAWEKHRKEMAKSDKIGLEELEGEDESLQDDQDGGNGESVREGREAEAAAGDREEQMRQADEMLQDLNGGSGSDNDATGGRKDPNVRRQQAAPGGPAPGDSAEGGDAEQPSGDGNDRGGRGGRDRNRDRNQNDPADGGNNGEGDQQDKKGEPIISPIEGDQMAVIMDRFTALPLPFVPGLINVNTAPAAVLKTVQGLSDEQVDEIVAKREQLGAEEKSTLAWLVTQNVIDGETFATVSNQLTTRSIQFTVEVVGFADDVNIAKRVQAVIEMRGQVGHVKYLRDLTEKGIGFDLWRDRED